VSVSDKKYLVKKIFLVFAPINTFFYSCMCTPNLDNGFLFFVFLPKDPFIRNGHVYVNYSLGEDIFT